ncbi:iron uptake system protein EfeO [Hyphomicrobium sp.]|uniref:iron uptake system protein EfeO n=1 Tax=Hyphomicrobium sp. TaxID=82 RepID=UPI000FBAF014|nr:iron uptake system protein EfeO [Hyphomicrobium sp.]RUO97502.1 MAG: iron uptake system protein EfeO [Hyphomicrobium sp.]
MRQYVLAVTALASALSYTGAANAEEDSKLVEPLAAYKSYVADNTEKLLENTTKFAEAIKAGDLAKAKSLFAPTRMNYEAVEPIAELFSDLDHTIDARADDFESKEKDAKFSGFHRIEYGLWRENSTKGLEPYADKLLVDVKDLNHRVENLTFPPEIVVGGASALMEEVAATKISGEEDRYSHTDLWDFKANFDGSQKIYELVKPLLAKDNADFVKKVDANFKVVDDTLGKYKTADGYELYDKLTEADRKILAAKVNALATDLSTLRGKLGLS